MVSTRSMSRLCISVCVATPVPLPITAAAFCWGVRVEPGAKGATWGEAGGTAGEASHDPPSVRATHGQRAVHRQQRPGDRAKAVRGMRLADRRLAAPAAKERRGDEREGHAGAE